MKVSITFDTYLTRIQDRLEKDAGKKYSKTELTAILAEFGPTIQIPIQKKKNGSVFDF